MNIIMETLTSSCLLIFMCKLIIYQKSIWTLSILSRLMKQEVQKKKIIFLQKFIEL